MEGSRASGGSGSTGSPKTPFMERMKQSLSGSGGGGGGSASPTNKGSPSASGGTSGGGMANRSASSALLRRRDREARNALSFAARALTEVVDTVEQAAKKVSLGSIATAVANIARDKKLAPQVSQTPAPIGVTQSCSVIFQHVIAPLWAVEAKPMPVPPSYVSFQTAECIRMMRNMDAMQVHTMLEQVLPTLHKNVDLSTAFVIFLCAKLRWVESQDTLVLPDVFAPTTASPRDAGGEGGANNSTSARTAGKDPTFEHLVLALREEYLRRDDSEMRYEDRHNDEAQTADHAKRRLEDVGGKLWKPKGANQLVPEAHEQRHRLLAAIMYASVVLTYNYNDPLLQFVVDEICCKQLFLTSFSEGFTSLVAGTKGAKYVCKYILFACRDTSRGESGGSVLSSAVSGGIAGAGGGLDVGGAAGAAAVDRRSHFAIPTIGVESVLMQSVATSVELALQNFVHRNDVSATLFRALHLAVSQVGNDDRTSPSALFYRITWALQQSYVADMELLVSLVDAIKPLVAKPNPIGGGALQLLHQIFANLRDVNSLQRNCLQRLFVGGPERSFRRVPAYAIVTPYCARSSLIGQIYWGDIDQRRGANTEAPTVLTHGVDPYTGRSFPQFDDASACLSNHLINVFQAMHELELGSQGEYDEALDRPVSFVNLRLLFSISPTTLASLYPAVAKIINQTGSGVSPNMSQEAASALEEMYMTIQDRHRPASGAVRFRNESPRLPVVPIRVHKYFDKDELEAVLKSMMDDFSTSCDARINDKDVAFLHPENHLSLRVYVDSNMKVVLGGGSGLLRRAVTASLRNQQLYPGAFVRPLFYLLPFGYGNDVAAWLARGDAVYRERIFNPLVAQAIKSVDAPTAEQWSNMVGTPADLQSLLHRDAINDYVTFANHVNEIVVYQAECQFVDPSYGTCHLPFVSNFEIGSHINAAVQNAHRMGLGGIVGNGILAPNQTLHAASFSTEKLRSSRSGMLSRQSTNQSSSGESGNNLLAGATGANSPSNFTLIGSPPPMSQQFAATVPPSNASVAPLASTFASAFSISIGDKTESLDRVLTRMHGHRGIPTSTKQHLVDGSDLPAAASGENILDWISTSYHIYDLGVAKGVAQSLLDSKLLATLCVPLGKDAGRFMDAGLYSILPREDVDTQPLCPPSSRSVLCEHSNLNRIEFEEQAASAGSAMGTSSGAGGGSGGGGGQTSIPSLMVRVTFQSFFENALQYNDLVDSKETGHRDIVSVKVKSAGAADDLGPLPHPCAPTLVMTLLQQDSKKKGNAGSSFSSKQQRDLGDMVDHYQIKYGERQWIDPRSVLQLDWKSPGSTSGGADAGFGGTAGSTASFGNTSGAMSFVNMNSPGTGGSAGGFGSGGVAAAMASSKSVDAMGMYCMCDGDVFGPFCSIRIKPVAVKTVQDAPANRSTFATASVMSFVKPQ